MSYCNHGQFRGVDIHVATVFRADRMENAGDFHKVALVMIVPEKSNPVGQIGGKPDRLAAVVPLAAGSSLNTFLHVGVIIDVDPPHAATDHTFADRLSFEAYNAPIPAIRVFNESRAGHLHACRGLSVRKCIVGVQTDAPLWGLCPCLGANKGMVRNSQVPEKHCYQEPDGSPWVVSAKAASPDGD